MPVCSRTHRVFGMRYLIQLLIPALIFIGVVYLLTRRGGGTAESDARGGRRGSDTGAFIVILVISAFAALGTAYLLQSMWE